MVGARRAAVAATPAAGVKGETFARTFGAKVPVGRDLLEREGERRIAALSQVASRGGTTCRVFTWSLPGGGWIGGAAARGACEPSADAAWIKQPELRPRDLWSGAIGPPARETLEREGPLPGTGELRLLGFGAGGAHVQDGSTRVVTGPPTDGVVRLQLPRERLPLHLAGVFDARAVDSSCGCTREPCGQLIVHRSVSFGEGPRSLSLLFEDSGDPRLMWSRTTAELFEADGPVYGAFADGDDCLVIGGRSGDRIALARVNRQTGAVTERWLR